MGSCLSCTLCASALVAPANAFAQNSADAQNIQKAALAPAPQPPSQEPMNAEEPENVLSTEPQNTQEDDWEIVN
jgi:hypothetical protein